MNQVKKFVGKEATHKNLGLVKVNSIVTNSRTLLNITILERGAGWNEKKQRYTGIKNSVGWMRGENREYLNEDVTHFKNLKINE